MRMAKNLLCSEQSGLCLIKKAFNDYDKKACKFKKFTCFNFDPIYYLDYSEGADFKQVINYSFCNLCSEAEDL